jgi:hypothetical protein
LPDSPARAARPGVERQQAGLEAIPSITLMICEISRAGFDPAIRIARCTTSPPAGGAVRCHVCWTDAACGGLPNPSVTCDIAAVVLEVGGLLLVAAGQTSEAVFEMLLITPAMPTRTVPMARASVDRAVEIALQLGIGGGEILRPAFQFCSASWSACATAVRRLRLFGPPVREQSRRGGTHPSPAMMPSSSRRSVPRWGGEIVSAVRWIAPVVAPAAPRLLPHQPPGPCRRPAAAAPVPRPARAQRRVVLSRLAARAYAGYFDQRGHVVVLAMIQRVSLSRCRDSVWPGHRRAVGRNRC